MLLPMLPSSLSRNERARLELLWEGWGVRGRLVLLGDGAPSPALLPPEARAARGPVCDVCVRVTVRVTVCVTVCVCMCCVSAQLVGVAAPTTSTASGGALGQGACV